MQPVAFTFSGPVRLCVYRVSADRPFESLGDFVRGGRPREPSDEPPATTGRGVEQGHVVRVLGRARSFPGGATLPAAASDGAVCRS